MPDRLGQRLARLTRPPQGGAQDRAQSAMLVVMAMVAAHFLVGTAGVLAVGLSVGGALAWIWAYAPRPDAPAPCLDESDTPCLVLRFSATCGNGAPIARDCLVEAVDLIEHRLRSECRSGDRLIRRESTSIAILPTGKHDTADMVQLACRMQRISARPLHGFNPRVELTPAVGFARLGQADSPTEEGAIRLAESAAAAAQRAGPGQIRAWSASLQHADTHRQRRAETLRRALAEGQIRPWFQPQISTDTSEITGLEALARWEHPDRGPIPPAEFLTDLLAAGLGKDLTRAMLAGSLEALVAWDKAGANIGRVAINLSDSDLGDPDLPAAVAAALGMAGLPAMRLGLEVLESVVCSDSGGPMARNLGALSELGCHIDLDDFGTGSASITTIRNLPVQRLKIDRSFIVGVDRDREQQAMVSAMITVADQLGLDTLAEGVETAGEHAMLAQLGCAHVQGYGIAPPMSVSALRDWALQHCASPPGPPRAQTRTATAVHPPGSARARRSGGKTA